MAIIGPPKSIDSDVDQRAESVDIDYIDTILLTLMRSSGNQIILGREIILTLPKDKEGPHGSLDILIGEFDENKTLDNYCILAHSTVYTEAKNATVSLCRLHPRVEDNTTYSEITEVAQPVMELLVYSKLAHKSKKKKKKSDLFCE